MIRKFWASKTEKIFKWVQIIGAIILAVSGAALKANPEDWTNWEIPKELVVFNQKHAFWIIPILTLLVGTASYFKSYFGSNSKWKTITYLLETYKKAIFEKHPHFLKDPEYYHRVTLYKYAGWRWAFCWKPWTGWMIPVARTGHTTHTFRIPRFRAPTGKPDEAEGVAGRVFVENKAISVCNLPEIGLESEDKDIKKYAEGSKVSVNWVRKRKICTSRALLGLPVEVGNKPWGVLVIDSRRPEEITREEALETPQYKTLTNILGKLLEN